MGERTVRRQIRNFASVAIAVAAMAAFGLVVRAQDPQEVGTWRPVGPMPHAYPGAAVAALADGRTVISGGQDADGSLRDSVLMLDPIANQIVEAGRLLEPRAGHTATELSDGAVIFERTYASYEWLAREILKEAGDAVVVEPEEARRAVLEAAEHLAVTA